MTTFTIELENKETGKVTINKMDAILNGSTPKEFIKYYCKRAHRRYLGA